MIAIPNNDEWNLFTDDLEPVATVEGANMRRVTVEGRTLHGDITAVWGVTKIVGEIPIGKPFDHREYQTLWFDFDGLHDSLRTTVASLSRVVLFGRTITGVVK